MNIFGFLRYLSWELRYFLLFLIGFSLTFTANILKIQDENVILVSFLAGISLVFYSVLHGFIYNDADESTSFDRFFIYSGNCFDKVFKNLLEIKSVVFGFLGILISMSGLFVSNFVKDSGILGIILIISGFLMYLYYLVKGE